MKNNILLSICLIFFQFFSLSSYSQDSSLVGTWKALKYSNQTKLPENITFDIFKDSLILIPDKNDTLNFTRMVKHDSASVLLKNILLNSKTNAFEAYQCRLYLNKKGNKIKAEYKLNDQVKKFIVEYAFQTECCDNHTPNDCADNPQDLQKLKDKGCKGFHRPK